MAYILLHILFPFPGQEQVPGISHNPQNTLIIQGETLANFLFECFCEFSPLSHFQGWVAIFERIRGTNLDNVGQECNHENIRLSRMFGQSDFLIQTGLAISELDYPPPFFAKNLRGVNRFWALSWASSFQAKKLIQNIRVLHMFFSQFVDLTKKDTFKEVRVSEAFRIS